MKLVNIGGQSWVNPAHVVAVQIQIEDTSRVEIFFENGTSAITGLLSAGAVVDGLLSISHYVWVKPEAVVSFSVEDKIATVRTIAGSTPKFQVEIEDDAQIALVLEYFESGGEVVDA